MEGMSGPWNTPKGKTAHSHEKWDESPENYISSNSSSITIIRLESLFPVPFVFFFLGYFLTCNENKQRNNECRYNVIFF